MTEIYKTYETASEVSGLSQCKLHALRIAGIVHTRIARDERGRQIPMVRIKDIVGWMEKHQNGATVLTSELKRLGMLSNEEAGMSAGLDAQ